MEIPGLSFRTIKAPEHKPVKPNQQEEDQVPLSETHLGGSRTLLPDNGERGYRGGICVHTVAHKGAEELGAAFVYIRQGPVPGYRLGRFGLPSGPIAVKK